MPFQATKPPAGKPARRRIGLPNKKFDLLGRPVISLHTPELQRFIASKTIMVTGAGGSIGSEICRQCLRFCPAGLILVERAENALFEIDRELRERWLGAQIFPTLADVTDRARMERVFDGCAPHVIFHAAAHKHVPMMEQNPGEAIKNNVLGTQVVADLAAQRGVGAFVLISTDKAVNPSSVMGASKRVAEIILQARSGVGFEQPAFGCKPNLQAASPRNQTRFSAVRFGNVLDSSGSVVPIFRQQIARGGPVTVTHADMRRYFMTIPEASQLVMQAAATGDGGEVFVLDMGQPIRIYDLAERLIREAGLRPHKDIQIRVTGIRPGEKLFEELAGIDDRTLPTAHRKIRVWALPQVTPRDAELMLTDLREVIDAPREHVIATLMRWVPEFRPPGSEQPLMKVVTESPAQSAAA